MNTSDALETLRRSESALRSRGVRRAALFGSVFDYVDIKEYIAGLFDGPVDVVSRDSLKPYVRPTATADAIYAF
jgi:predicted nucleotidyltransferase